MTENDQKPNSSFRSILQALLPFYIDGRPEKARYIETFSCNLEEMTPDGKIELHIFLTHFSQIAEVTSLYHQCSCKYFKLLPRQDQNSISQGKVAPTTHITCSQSVQVQSASQLWLLKKPNLYRQVWFYFDLFIYTVRRFQQFLYSLKIRPLYHNCFESTVMSTLKHQLHLRTSWEPVLMCTVQSSPQKVSLPPSFPSLQAQFCFNYPRQ